MSDGMRATAKNSKVTLTMSAAKGRNSDETTTVSLTTGKLIVRARRCGNGGDNSNWNGTPKNRPSFRAASTFIGGIFGFLDMEKNTVVGVSPVGGEITERTAQAPTSLPLQDSKGHWICSPDRQHEENVYARGGSGRTAQAPTSVQLPEPPEPKKADLCTEHRRKKRGPYVTREPLLFCPVSHCQRSMERFFCGHLNDWTWSNSAQGFTEYRHHYVEAHASSLDALVASPRVSQ